MQSIPRLVLGHLNNVQRDSGSLGGNLLLGGWGYEMQSIPRLIRGLHFPKGLKGGRVCVGRQSFTWWGFAMQSIPRIVPYRISLGPVIIPWLVWLKF